MRFGSTIASAGLLLLLPTGGSSFSFFSPQPHVGNKGTAASISGGRRSRLVDGSRRSSSSKSSLQMMNDSDEANEYQVNNVNANNDDRRGFLSKLSAATLSAFTSSSRH
eukprot:g5587.t1 g5587   contig2:861178-861504(-)